MSWWLADALALPAPTPMLIALPDGKARRTNRRHRSLTRAHDGTRPANQEIVDVVDRRIALPGSQPSEMLTPACGRFQYCRPKPFLKDAHQSFRVGGRRREHVEIELKRIVVRPTRAAAPIPAATIAEAARRDGSGSVRHAARPHQVFDPPSRLILLNVRIGINATLRARSDPTPDSDPV